MVLDHLIKQVNMAVVARIRCDKVTIDEYGQKVAFVATNRKDGDNADFTKFTPFGNSEFYITKEAPAYGKFSPGKYYELTFNEME